MPAKKTSARNQTHQPERLVVYKQIVNLRVALNLLHEVSCYTEGSEMTAKDQREAMFEAKDNLESVLGCQLTYWNKLERSNAKG